MNYNEMTATVEELVVRVASLEKTVASLKASLEECVSRLNAIENIEA